MRERAIARIRALVRVETLALALATLALVTVGAIDRAARERRASVDSYSSYDAASGGYRAAYELLAREGVRVERFERRPAFLDAGIATLVYAEPIAGDPRARIPTKNDLAALEAWLRDGGRLLFIGADEAAASANVAHLPHLARGRARGSARIDASLRARGVSRIAPLESLRYASPRAGTRILARAARGAYVLAYPYGRGEVVATIDRAIFSNARIATADRARLFVALATPRRAGIVAFDELPHGFETPERWWAIVPRPFLVGLAFALVVLLVAIAGAALRLGPPLVPIPRDDRGTADFVVALAALLARVGDVRGTLAEAEAATSRALARAYGLAATASGEEIAARLEGVEARVRYATLREIVRDGDAAEATLVRGVALAQRLRKDVSAYVRSRD
ncbi:MAG: hypothetical protein NVSMB21_21520 [Vulcanimicrobiaceae bacterium]